MTHVQSPHLLHLIQMTLRSILRSVLLPVLAIPGSPVTVSHTAGALAIRAASMRGGEFSGVVALSRKNAWAVGVADGVGTSSRCGALVEHWDGKRWSIASTPNRCLYSFSAVAAISARDIWAAGGADGFGVAGVLTEHWNGRRWRAVPNPTDRSHDARTHAFNEIRGIAAVSRNDIWLVGDRDSGPLTEDWNGRSWSVIPTPGGSNDILDGVAAPSRSDVWAVGSTESFPLIEHWNGEIWR